MRIKTIALSLAVISALSIGFSGCGSSSSAMEETKQTGTFVDAPVKGLKYITDTLEGYTDDNGSFAYLEGESVEFKLGNLSFGTVKAGEMITPYTMGDSNTTTPSKKTKNIAMLLQNFDLNRSNSNQLDLSKLKDYNFSDINLTTDTANMEANITAISAAIIAHSDFGASFIDTNTTLIDTNTSLNKMKDFVAEYSAPTVADGFGIKWLNGRTLYLVKYSEYHKKWEKSTLSFALATTSTQKHTISITEDSGTSTAYWHVGSGLHDGELVTQEIHNGTSHYLKYKVLSTQANKITTEPTSSGDAIAFPSRDTNDAYFSLTEAKATEIYDSKK